MVRLTLPLQGYTYELRHKPGRRHQNADALSRVPYVQTVKEVHMPPETIHLIETLNSGPVTATAIAQATMKDAVLARLHHYLLTGWPAEKDTILQQFTAVRDELSLHGQCILRGARVIIPEVLREPILQELHCGHPGIVRMKALARSFVWWPLMDRDIERIVRQCEYEMPKVSQNVFWHTRTDSSPSSDTTFNV